MSNAVNRIESELAQQSSLSTEMENLIEALSVRKNHNIKLTEEEQSALAELYKFMKDFV